MKAEIYYHPQLMNAKEQDLAQSLSELVIYTVPVKFENFQNTVII